MNVHELVVIRFKFAYAYLPVGRKYDFRKACEQ